MAMKSQKNQSMKMSKMVQSINLVEIAEDEQLEYLAQQAAEHCPDDEDDDDDDNWSVVEFLDEDVYFTTILDELPAQTVVARLMSSLSERGYASVLEAQLIPEKQKLLSNFINSVNAN